MNVTAERTVYKRAGTRNPFCVHEMVDGYAKTRGKKEVRRWRGGYGGQGLW